MYCRLHHVCWFSLCVYTLHTITLIFRSVVFQHMGSFEFGMLLSSPPYKVRYTVIIVLHRGVNDVPGAGVSELCLSEALEPSEYSYFNLAVTSTWAGPHHWKLRPRNNITQKGMQQCIVTARFHEIHSKLNSLK